MKPKPPPFGDKHHGAGTAAFQLWLKKHQSRPPGRCDVKKGKIQTAWRCPIAISSALPTNWLSHLPGKTSTDLLVRAAKAHTVAEGKRTRFHPAPLRPELREGAREQTHQQPQAPERLQPPAPRGPRPTWLLPTEPNVLLPGNRKPDHASQPCAGTPWQRWVRTLWEPNRQQRSRNGHEKPRHGVKHKLGAHRVPSVSGPCGAGTVRQRLLRARITFCAQESNLASPELSIRSLTSHFFCKACLESQCFTNQLLQARALPSPSH